MILRTIYGLLLIIFFSGCAGMGKAEYKLSEEGESVKLVEYLSPADKENLEEFTMIKCELSGGFGTQLMHVDKCKNYLRNMAAKKGGSLVLIPSEKQKLGGNMGGINCPNCVEMQGIVFKNK